MKRPRREGRHGAESLPRTKTLRLPEKRHRAAATVSAAASRRRASSLSEEEALQGGVCVTAAIVSVRDLSVGDIFFNPNPSEISTLADLQPLASCPRLKRLDLRGNPVTQTADVEAELGQLLPSVTELLL